MSIQNQQVMNKQEISLVKDKKYGRGIVIALSRKVIKLHEILYRVESETVNGKFYSVIFKDGAPTSCSCPSFEHHKDIVCKHMLALCHSLANNTVVDETDKKEELTIVKKSWKEEEYSY